MLDRPAQIRRGKRVIDDQRHARLVRDLGDSLEIDDIHSRISNRLDVDELRLVCDRCAEVFRVVGLDEGRVEAQTPEGDIELCVGATVERRRGDQVVAALAQAADGEKLRRLAARERQRADAALQRSHALLEHGRCGVHDARVDVAEALQAEQGCGVVGVFENVGGRLIDRDRPCPGGRVRLLPGVQSPGVEIERALFVFGHKNLSYRTEDRPS